MARRRQRPPKTRPCRDCGAPVVMAINCATGSYLPLDPIPDPRGGIVLDADRYPAGVTPVCRVLLGEERVRLEQIANPRKRFAHHKATCKGAPDAAHH